MELTPERTSTAESTTFLIAEDHGATSPPVKRLKKPPPITPRRFEKFFTPRPRNARHAVRTSRTALRDITRSTINQKKPKALTKIDLSATGEQPVSKKRKLSFTSHTSSVQSSPIKGPLLLFSSQEQPDILSKYQEDVHKQEARLYGCEIVEEEDTDIEDTQTCGAEVIRPYPTISTSASLLSSRISGRRAKREVEHNHAWQNSTANFYSSPEDVYSSSTANSGFLALPFSVTSCNTNSLVAVGNEDGNIHLVDSAAGDKEGFSRTYLAMRPHDNAIMDLAFSNDDSLLATASGDQTGQVIDMQTQTSIYCLSGHYSSIKHVEFQPGSGNNVIATCSRDGQVNFWDLRCRTVDRPSFHLRSSGRTDGDAMTTSMRYSSMTNSIREAHAISTGRSRKSDAKTKPTPVLGRNDFSVTSLSFLGPTRPHMLVTASEVDAVVKVWDMRTTYNSRRGRPIPVSCTREPKSHATHRRYGLTSLALSTDGARLYTLCRDHTVYAYATSHLILGSAPEMSTRSSRPFRPGEIAEEGLGPLYGLRHPRLCISTFYPKLAIRKSKRKDIELLAVGSSNDCAIVFPTNERYLAQNRRILPTLQPPPPPSSIHNDSVSEGVSRRDTTFDATSRGRDDGIPIYNLGTALTRGHRKEVTAVTWTSEGSLVTASDDFNTRCWREDPVRARDMRIGGEGEGRRWGAGWADIDAEFDEDD